MFQCLADCLKFNNCTRKRATAIFAKANISLAEWQISLTEGEYHINKVNISLPYRICGMALYGDAMASTGVATLGKRVAVAGHALKTANLKINDNNKVALAA